MSFGELQLKKYGWEEGKGLGREENGICNALKPKLKFNSAGLGHDQSEEFTYHWWDHVYNKAANNLSVQNKEGKIEIVKSEELELSTKKSSLKKNKTSSGYGNFVKGCVLEGDKIVQNEDIETDKTQEKSLELIKTFSDQELFEMCGGLTAHKGARHGLTMSAKLARLEQQEKAFLDTCVKNNDTEYKSKKRDRKLLEASDQTIPSSFEERENISTKLNYEKVVKLKKKNKEREEEENLIGSHIYIENSGNIHEEYNECTKKRKKKKKDIINENNFEESRNIPSIDNEYNESDNERKIKKKTKYNENNIEKFVHESIVDEEYNESTKKRKKKKNINTEINLEESIPNEECSKSNKNRKKKKRKEKYLDET